MDIKLSKNLVQDRICQMIYRAETFLKWTILLFNLYETGSEKYKNKIEKLNNFYNKPATQCIVLHHVLYFQEVILALNTLFEKKNKPSEISFCYYFKNIEKSELEKDIEILRKKYFNPELVKIRNKIFAHKQIDMVGDPVIGFINPVNTEIVEKTNLIIKKLKEIAGNNFNCAANNYFEGLYKQAFDVVYKTCEKYLTKEIEL